MASVKFLAGTSEDFNSLETKDNGTLYFLSDTQEIYKGSVLYGCGKTNAIQIKTCAEWDAAKETVPQAGMVLVYSDRKDENGKSIPDFKIADGESTVEDTDFYSDNIMGYIIQNIGFSRDDSGNKFFSGTAAKVQNALIIGDYTYDGSEEVTIPVYVGEYSK